MAWHEGSDGQRRWGRHGAAGVLFRYASPGSPDRFYLAKRGVSTHQGGTWGIPGGALKDGENPEDAARREAFEEVGYGGPWRAESVFQDSPASNWSYWTYLAPSTSRSQDAAARAG